MKDRYPLASILRVRLLHEKKAQDALFSAKDTLKRAKEAYDTRVQELEDYKAWRPREEDRRYRAIFGLNLSQDDLDAFRSGITGLADEELHKEELCREAMKEVEHAKTKVEEAQIAVREARSACKKLESHKEQWLEEERKEAERQSDLAMEDVRPPQPMSDDA